MIMPSPASKRAVVIIERADPFADGQTTVTITLDGLT
jgi:hypothetical protein